MGDLVVGIDLGTTNSVMCALDDTGRPQALKNREGQYATPSVICFLLGGKPIVGTEAVNVVVADEGWLLREPMRGRC